mmetsp:Transcript_107779/g.300417  ORF Transcript_107779/g.300417 Transcript_107779/m.300417 type:complete len:233 (-) Transcript_107779:44-742(-)
MLRGRPPDVWGVHGHLLVVSVHHAQASNQVLLQCHGGPQQPPGRDWPQFALGMATRALLQPPMHYDLLVRVCEQRPAEDRGGRARGERRAQASAAAAERAYCPGVLRGKRSGSAGLPGLRRPHLVRRRVQAFCVHHVRAPLLLALPPYAHGAQRCGLQLEHLPHLPARARADHYSPPVSRTIRTDHGPLDELAAAGPASCVPCCATSAPVLAQLRVQRGRQVWSAHSLLVLD